MSPEQRSPLLEGERDLVANGDHAAGEVVVVFHEQADSDHEVVDVVEDQGTLLGVGLLLLQERAGVVAPVPQRVQVVRGVVPVVEAVAVALYEFCVLSGLGDRA